ncbi:YkgJ family cysteine cluster protein [Glaciimonas sp. GG7]
MIKASLSCRLGCGACCIAPSISSAIPGMPDGKPAGVRCIQLDDGNKCLIFGSPARPSVCGSLQPSAEMCGIGQSHAMAYLGELERLTAVTYVVNYAVNVYTKDRNEM